MSTYMITLRLTPDQCKEIITALQDFANGEDGDFIGGAKGEGKFLQDIADEVRSQLEGQS